MANNASNYYASVGSSIMNNDGSNELSSAVDNSIKTYALNLAQQQEMNNLLDKSVNALTLNEKDANGNYTGFSKIFHDEVAKDRANQIDKSAEDIKNKKMQELQNMQNSLLQEQNNLQVNGITQAVTGQNYADFSNNLNRALENKYTSAGGNAMSIDTIKYYVQNPNMVLEAEKAHQLAAQNGTTAQTTLKKEDIVGLKAILQDRNLITLFEKDRYIENERDRLNKGYFTPEENLQRAGMLKQVNEWAYRTNTQQEVANMLDSRTAGIMGRKQGESYEENLDRIINAKNQISLSNAVDRFGNINSFPISSDINNNTNPNVRNNTASNFKQGQTTDINNNTQEDDDTMYVDSLDDDGNVIQVPISKDAYEQSDLDRMKFLNEEERILKGKLDEIKYQYTNDPAKQIQDEQILRTNANKDNEAQKRVTDLKASQVLISGSSDAIGQATDRAIDSGINFATDATKGYVIQGIGDNIGKIGIGVGAGFLLYQLFREKNPDAKIDVTPEQAQKMSAKEFSDYVTKKGFNIKEVEAEVDAIMDEMKKNAKADYDSGKMTRQEYDRITKPEAYDDESLRRECREEWKKKYGKEPTSKELNQATKTKKQALLDKTKELWNKTLNSKVANGLKYVAKEGKSLAKFGSKVLGATAISAEIGMEIYDQTKGYMTYKDLNKAGVDNPEEVTLQLQAINRKIEQGSVINSKENTAYDNISNEELDFYIKNLEIAKKANQDGSGIVDSVFSPIESATRLFSGQSNTIDKYDALIQQAKTIKEIKELNQRTTQAEVNAINSSLKETIEERDNIMKNKANLSALKDESNKYYKESDNANSLEEKVALREKGYDLNKKYDRANKAKVDKSLSDLSYVYGENRNTTVGKTNEIRRLKLLGNNTNNETKNSITAKSSIAGIDLSKESDIKDVSGSGSIFFTAAIQGEYSDKNYQELVNESNKGTKQYTPFTAEINDAINELSIAYGSNKIQGAFSSAGVLHSKFEDFIKTLDNKQFRNKIRFTHIEKRLTDEVNNIKEDKLVTSFLGNSVKNLDTMSLWGLKVAIYYNDNPTADFSDPKIIREIINLNTKKAIENRVKSAKLNKNK